MDCDSETLSELAACLTGMSAEQMDAAMLDKAALILAGDTVTTN